MLTPLSPCDLSEFDLGAGFFFLAGVCAYRRKARSQKDVNQFCTLVPSEGIQTGQSWGWWHLKSWDLLFGANTLAQCPGRAASLGPHPQNLPLPSASAFSPASPSHWDFKLLALECVPRLVACPVWRVSFPAWNSLGAGSGLPCGGQAPAIPSLSCGTVNGDPGESFGSGGGGRRIEGMIWDYGKRPRLESKKKTACPPPCQVQQSVTSRL